MNQQSNMIEQVKRKFQIQLLDYNNPDHIDFMYTIFGHLDEDHQIIGKKIVLQLNDVQIKYLIAHGFIDTKDANSIVGCLRTLEKINSNPLNLVQNIDPANGIEFLRDKPFKGILQTPGSPEMILKTSAFDLHESDDFEKLNKQCQSISRSSGLVEYYKNFKYNFLESTPISIIVEGPLFMGYLVSKEPGEYKPKVKNEFNNDNGKNDNLIPDRSYRQYLSDLFYEKDPKRTNYGSQAHVGKKVDTAPLSLVDRLKNTLGIKQTSTYNKGLNTINSYLNAESLVNNEPKQVANKSLYNAPVYLCTQEDTSFISDYRNASIEALGSAFNYLTNLGSNNNSNTSSNTQRSTSTNYQSSAITANINPSAFLVGPQIKMYHPKSDVYHADFISSSFLFGGNFSTKELAGGEWVPLRCNPLKESPSSKLCYQINKYKVPIVNSKIFNYTRGSDCDKENLQNILEKAGEYNPILSGPSNKKLNIFYDFIRDIEIFSQWMYQRVIMAMRTASDDKTLTQEPYEGMLMKMKKNPAKQNYTGILSYSCIAAEKTWGNGWLYHLPLPYKSTVKGLKNDPPSKYTITIDKEEVYLFLTRKDAWRYDSKNAVCMASKGITGEKIEKVLMMAATPVVAFYAVPLLGAFSQLVGSGLAYSGSALTGAGTTISGFGGGVLSPVGSVVGGLGNTLGAAGLVAGGVGNVLNLGGTPILSSSAGTTAGSAAGAVGAAATAAKVAGATTGATTAAFNPLNPTLYTAIPSAGLAAAVAPEVSDDLLNRSDVSGSNVQASQKKWYERYGGKKKRSKKHKQRKHKKTRKIKKHKQHIKSKKGKKHKKTKKH